jgi:hypothetical protein
MSNRSALHLSRGARLYAALALAASLAAAAQPPSFPRQPTQKLPPRPVAPLVTPTPAPTPLPRPVGLAPAPGSAPGAEYRRFYANGRVRDEAVRAVLGGRPGFRQLDYYEDGSPKRELEWVGGKLNGSARLYRPGRQLQREIVYRDDRVIDYKEFHEGRLHRQIGADRKTFVNNGQRFTVRWDKYYERLPGGRLVGFTTEGLVDWLLTFRPPAEVTQTLADLSRFFDQKTGAAVSEANDIVSCGSGKAALGNDANLSSSTLRTAAGAGSSSSPSAAGKAAMARVNAAAASVASACGGSGGTASRGVSVGGAGARAGQIAQAEQALDQAAQSCRSSGTFGPGSGMFASGAETAGGFRMLQVLSQIQAAEAATAAAAADTAITGGAAAAGSGSAIAEVSVIEGLSASAITESGSVARGFVALEVLAVPAAVVASFAAGWTVGTLINESEAGRVASDYWIDLALKVTGNTGDEPPGAGRPNPESKGDRCDGLESFKQTCQATGWATRQCTAFMGIVTGCKGDITRIQVAGNDGDVFSVGCPVSACRGTGTVRTAGSGGSATSSGVSGAGPVDCPEDDAEALRQRCERQGLIAQPGPGGALQCGPRSVHPADVPRGPDPGQINPERGG